MFAFDLISDLHIETWPDDFDWQGFATSPYCIITGDVARDRGQMLRTLKHLGSCYRAVFYIDGNDEHVDYWQDLDTSYSNLTTRIKRVSNVVYLQNNVIIVDGVAILGTNGWWGFDFSDTIDPTQVAKWFQDRWQGQCSTDTLRQISERANADAAYLRNSVRKLQTHGEVKHIVIATHTVPLPELIEHDIELSQSMRFNCMGNQALRHCLDADIEGKIHTWCFGHYHMPVDQVRDRVRFVNNCRGRGDSAYRQWAYQPRRIEINV